MQALVLNRMLNRFVIISLVAITIILISWRSNPGRIPAFLPNMMDSYLADTLSRSGASTDRQIKALQDLIRSNPNDWQAHSQLGLAYLQKARETGDPSYYQRVEEALNRSLDLEPNDYTSISAQSALALARHQFLLALEWGERARQINSYRSYAYGVIADAQIELGRYPEAIQTIQTMVDLRPDMSSYSRISYVRELHGDTAGALEMMQLAVDSGVPDAESTAWARTQLAALYFNSGKLERAEAEYQHTLRDRPGYVYALAGLGRVRAAQGSTSEAIELLNQACNIIPMPEFVIMLGDLYQATGQVQAAQEQYKLVGVIETLYRANGVDMDMEIALFNADRNQNLDSTVALAHRAYKARPSIHAADVLAWALYKKGDYKGAQAYSQEALRLGTNDSLKLFHAGMIAYRLGDEAQARIYLKQALSTNPYFSILYADEAKRTLELIQRPDVE
jgi:tetratricopeptide (TPR) repeat protein